MKRNNLPDIKPVITQQNFPELGYEFDPSESVKEKMRQAQLQHYQDMEDLLLNVIAYGVAYTSLAVETKLHNDPTNSFTLEFRSRVFIKPIPREDILYGNQER